MTTLRDGEERRWSTDGGSRPSGQPFEAIRQAQQIHGEVLPHEVMQRPVTVQGHQIAIFSLQRGIHKPRQLDAALALTTTPPKRGREAPYEDRFGPDGTFRYHYRDPRTDSKRALSRGRA